MNGQELYDFLMRYLTLKGCAVLEKSPAHITARLSEEADREIMNRPYYWLYVDRTGVPAEPMTVTFYFDPANTFAAKGRAELIHLGSPRLHHIFQACHKQGQYIRLYEQTESSSGVKRPLTPWLCLNYTISFVCDQKRELYYPLGFNLINGEIIAPFDDYLETYRFTPKIPDYSFTLTPIFSLASAVKRIETHLSDYIRQMDPAWAIQAKKRLEEERELILSFFENDENKKEILSKRLAELEEYEPRIEVTPINVGLFYLATHPLTKETPV